MEMGATVFLYLSLFIVESGIDMKCYNIILKDLHISLTMYNICRAITGLSR